MYVKLKNMLTLCTLTARVESEKFIHKFHGEVVQNY